MCSEGRGARGVAPISPAVPKVAPDDGAGVFEQLQPRCCP